MESAGYKLVAAFVTLILGVVLITVVAGQANNVTTKTVVLNESTDLATAGCVTADDWSVNESLTECNITVTI